jgi:hypothetical protein
MRRATCKAGLAGEQVTEALEISWLRPATTQEGHPLQGRFSHVTEREYFIASFAKQGTKFPYGNISLKSVRIEL